LKPAYAGIGSRETPIEILQVIRSIARVLAKDDFLCKTGAAPGADQAFAEGALCRGGDVEICLPWPSYETHWVSQLVGTYNIRTLADTDEQAFASVDRLHPFAHNLKQGAKKLHARNFLILQDVRFVICWTTKGLETGGTGQGIRIAQEAGIPIHNLGNPNVLKHFIDKLQELGEFPLL